MAVVTGQPPLRYVPNRLAGARSDSMGLTHNAVESNVFQRTVDYPDEWHNGHHVMLDTEILVTVRWEQVEAMR